MSANIVGREEQLQSLGELLTSDNPEFLAIYGRRRVGKTFLIRSYFEDKDVIFFNVTGSKKGMLSEQISHFTKQIGKIFYKGARLAAGKNWDATFEILTEAIESVENKKVV